MIRLLPSIVVALVFLTQAASCPSAEPAEPKAATAGIHWIEWDNDIFSRAKSENKLVLLDLGAVWCHWCHVMDEITYRDADVVRIIGAKYLAVRVDQDARPDLSNRYEDYGWPATIVFSSDGKELAKRSGYLPPRPMASMLQAFADDPTPGPSVQPESPIAAATGTAFNEATGKEMRQRLLDAYDHEDGGWGDAHHFLNWDAIEYCLSGATQGDSTLETMARQTLTGGLKLLDPVWGGVYQYSTDGDWDHPHFEKIMPFQAENLRIFAQAYALWHEPVWLKSAQDIRRYLRTFLMNSDGAFYTSQDADVVQGEHAGEYFKLDDAARRKRGVPRVDTHLYARDNGLAITGLAALYTASGDVPVLDDATRAAAWVIAHRSIPGGGFRHDDVDKAGPYLADNLAMARAFVQLHAATGDRQWLARANEAAAFIERTFKGDVGYCTAAPAKDSPFPAKPQVDENIMLARFANLLNRYTGSTETRAMAEHAMRFLTAPSTIAERGYAASGILMAEHECATEPRHVTIVGAKDDATARALFATASRSPVSYKVVEWYDVKEGPLPRKDVDYPTLPHAAAFFCSEGRCSAPVSTVEALENEITGKK